MLGLDGMVAAGAAWSQANVRDEGWVSLRTVVYQISQSAPFGCANSMEVVRDALHYFGMHFRDPILMPELADALGTTLACLDFSFDRIRGVTPVQALLEHRLNRLFTTLTDQPRQGLSRAVRACGLASTANVLALFEQEFGIAMPLFLLTCRRAADDRLFRLEHPEPEALVLPI